MESQLVVNLGGRRGTEKAGVNFTLTTPHPHFQKFGFDFHRDGGANSLYSAVVELDDFKVLVTYFGIYSDFFFFFTFFYIFFPIAP